MTNRGGDGGGGGLCFLFPQEVNIVGDGRLSEGNSPGRVRINSFYYCWGICFLTPDDTGDDACSHQAAGV